MTGEPIEGVKISDGSQSVITDVYGHYTLSGYRSGDTVFLLTMHNGYKPNTQYVTMGDNQNQIVNIVLEPIR